MSTLRIDHMCEVLAALIPAVQGIPVSPDLIDQQYGLVSRAASMIRQLRFTVIDAHANTIVKLEMLTSFCWL
jgi:hypothetical protein